MTDQSIEQTLVWLETWVEQHAPSRAAQKVNALLKAYQAVQGTKTQIEGGAPAVETAEKYLSLKDEVVSMVPAGSLWEKNFHDEDELLRNFVWHLYHSHTLGCVECFGGQHPVR